VIIELTHIFVAPSHRKQGIGSSLVRLAADKAKATGLPLSVSSEPGASGFFLKHGFTETKHVDVDLSQWTPPNSEWGVQTERDEEGHLSNAERTHFDSVFYCRSNACYIAPIPFGEKSTGKDSWLSFSSKREPASWRYRIVMLSIYPHITFVSRPLLCAHIRLFVVRDGSCLSRLMAL
jgi:hypothetical protein